MTLIIESLLRKLDSDSDYKQYKRDTGVIATWLAQTAIAHGYTPSSIRSAKKNRKKKEGKKKKAAGAGGQGGTGAQPRGGAEEHRAQNGEGEILGDGMDEGLVKDDLAVHTSAPREHILKLPEFIDIACLLAERRTAIPHDLLRVIRRCIRTRTNMLKRYADSPDELYDSHQHFVRVLGEVEAILEPHVVRKTPITPLTNPSAPAVAPISATPVDARLVNRFAELNCAAHDQDTADEDELETIHILTPATTALTRPSSDARFAPERDRLEALGEVLDFLLRVREVRQEIQALWKRYRDGDVDLIPASVATNTALERIRLSYNVLSPILAAMFEDDPDRIVSSMVRFVSKVGPVHFDPDRSLKDLHADEVDALEAHELCLSPALILLDDVIPYHIKGLLYSEDGIDYAEVYDDSVGSDESLFRRWRNSEILIGDAFPQYLAVLMAGTDVLPERFAKFNVSPFLHDEMALEMARFDQREQWSLLGLVHAQIYADIALSAGRSATQRASAELKRGAKDMLNRLERAGFDVKKPMHPDFWVNGPVYAQLLILLITRLKPWSHPTTNPVGEIIRAYNEDIMFSMDLAPQPDTGGLFVDYSPMFCGLQLLSMQLDLRPSAADASTESASTSTTADSSLHAWPLMDDAIRLHGGWKVFAGYEPKTYKYLAYSLQLSAGLKAPMLGFVRHGLAADPVLLPGKSRPSHVAHAHSPTTYQALVQAVEGGDLSKYMAGDRPHLEASCPAVDALTARYAPYIGKPPGGYLDIGRLASLVHPQTTTPQPVGTRPSPIIGKCDTGASRKASGSNKNKRRNRSGKAGAGDPRLDVTAMSHIVRDCLARERESLEFDYIQLHVECMRILRAVHAANAEWLPAWLLHGWPVTDLSPKDVPAEMMLEYMPAAILQLVIAPDGERHGDDVLRRVWPRGDWRMCVLDRLVETMAECLAGWDK